MDVQLILWARNKEDLQHRFIIRNAMLLLSAAWVGGAMVLVGTDLFDPSLSHMRMMMLQQAMFQIFDMFVMHVLVAAGIFIVLFRIIIGGIAAHQIDENDMVSVRKSAKNDDGAAADQMAAWYQRDSTWLAEKWYKKALTSGYRTAHFNLKRLRRKLLLQRLREFVRSLWSGKQ